MEADDRFRVVDCGEGSHGVDCGEVALKWPFDEDCFTGDDRGANGGEMAVDACTDYDEVDSGIGCEFSSDIRIDRCLELIRRPNPRDLRKRLLRQEGYAWRWLLVTIGGRC